MDFGEAHKDAMNRRLHKSSFRSLSQVEPETNQCLREHAMDCIVWAQKMAATNPTTAQTGRILGELEDGLKKSDEPKTTAPRSEQDPREAIYTLDRSEWLAFLVHRNVYISRINLSAST